AKGWGRHGMREKKPAFVFSSRNKLTYHDMQMRSFAPARNRAPAHARIHRCPDCGGYWLLDLGHEPRPTTAATMMIGVFPKTICHSTPVSLPGVSYNRNHSRPKARSRFRDDNCGANAHPLPTRDQNISPNRGALLPVAGAKNKS